MTKAIKLGTGEIKEMTFEEVLEQFNQMVNRFATQAIEKIVYNKPEREEVLQELRLQVWEAYRRYDGNNAFSTYLHYRLQHGVHKATMKLYAQKRTNDKGIVSLSKIISGEGDGEQEFEGLLGEDDTDIVSFEFRHFMNQLEKILDTSEKKILKVLIDKGDYSVQDLADDLGMSRQGANKKVNKFREKMAQILINSGYAM